MGEHSLASNGVPRYKCKHCHLRIIIIVMKYRTPVDTMTVPFEKQYVLHPSLGTCGASEGIR